MRRHRIKGVGLSERHEEWVARNCRIGRYIVGRSESKVHVHRIACRSLLRVVRAVHTCQHGEVTVEERKGIGSVHFLVICKDGLRRVMR